MIPKGTRVYFAVEPTDLRRSFDGLAATANSVMRRDPVEGGLFVFFNRRANQVRILFRDPHGWCVFAKRLDQGRFKRPVVRDGEFSWETDAPSMLEWLGAIDISKRRASSLSSNHLRLAT